MTPPKIPGPKLFTLAEAERALPAVRKRLARFQEVYSEYESIRKDLAVLRLVSASGGDQKNPDLTELTAKERQQSDAMEELRSIQEELLDIGCLPKSIQDGLIDFFALKEGRLVFLCWKQGEESIQAWHTLDGGFAGRMPIESFLESASSEEGPA